MFDECCHPALLQEGKNCERFGRLYRCRGVWLRLRAAWLALYGMPQQLIAVQQQV